MINSQTTLAGCHKVLAVKVQAKGTVLTEFQDYGQNQKGNMDLYYDNIKYILLLLCYPSLSH